MHNLVRELFWLFCLQILKTLLLPRNLYRSQNSENRQFYDKKNLYLLIVKKLLL